MTISNYDKTKGNKPEVFISKIFLRQSRDLCPLNIAIILHFFNMNKIRILEFTFDRCDKKQKIQYSQDIGEQLFGSTYFDY